ncbi:hypothetical protein EDB87DRAFT_464161 [Lactarius vividus]|nr:hypothetical protein EDB87DRAFT_464161 [Lactarius vividus]
MTCPRAHVPHGDMVRPISPSYTLPDPSCPTCVLARSSGLPRRTRRLPSRTAVGQTTSHPFEPCKYPAWMFFFFFFATLTFGIECVQEAAPVRSNMPQFCSPPLSAAREMLAHAFLSRQHLWFLAAACEGIPSPFHCSSSDGLSCNTPSASNHTKLM